MKAQNKCVHDIRNLTRLAVKHFTVLEHTNISCPLWHVFVKRGVKRVIFSLSVYFTRCFKTIYEYIGKRKVTFVKFLIVNKSKHYITLKKPDFGLPTQLSPNFVLLGKKFLNNIFMRQLVIFYVVMMISKCM